MALSNWDTAAIDLNGNPSNGVFISPKGVIVEFYKNWIYVRDKKAWTKNLGTSDHMVMTVNEGNLTYKDVNIIAKRGPQTGIYAAVFVDSWATDDRKTIGMVGCSVYGYNTEGEVDEDGWAIFDGVKESSKQFLVNWITEKEFKTREETEQYYFGIEIRTYSDDGKMTTDHPYIAFKEEKPDEWNEIIEEAMQRTVMDEDIASVDFSKMIRFNQGDAYFVGVENSSTEIGAAEDTIMAEACKSWKEDEDGNN